MTDRLGATFDACRARGRAALVPYFTSGHPVGVAPAEVLTSIAAAGADVIELGVPFSDPLADGPVIQAASSAALGGGASLTSTLAGLRSFRAGNSRTPVVLFSYLNPVMAYGMEAFLADASDAGADGLLLTDLPVGADPKIEKEVGESELDLIRLVAPTTEPDRIGEIGARSSGFVYYISRTGVTGDSGDLRTELEKEVGPVRLAAGLPVAVGFGITTPEHAKWVAGLADGVVVGSALVRKLDEGGLRAGCDFVAELGAAVAAG